MLEYLDLSGSQVTDAGLVKLAELFTLDTLCLHQTMVTPDGVEMLKASLPNCEIYFSPPFGEANSNSPFAGADTVGQ